MSNPAPFKSPLYSEEDEFIFPIAEAPDEEDDPNHNPLVNQEISRPPGYLPTSISLPTMSEYQDLSMFLDYYEEEEDYRSALIIGQCETTNWAEIGQVHPPGLDDQAVQQGAHDQGSSVGRDDDHQEIIQHRLMTDNYNNQAPPGAGSSSIKKLDHNAKERVRRLRLSESYLSLRSLLPDSRRAKSRWSAPYIIDRAVDYIPQLQGEIDKLTLEKTNMQQVMATNQVRTITDDQDANKDYSNNNSSNHNPTVSINEVKRGELVIQICRKKEEVDKLSLLIEKLECEGIVVVAASTLSASQHRSCFHLHLQMDENALEADYVAALHKKLIYWLS